MRTGEAYSVLLPSDSLICFSEVVICAMEHFILSFIRFLEVPPEVHLPVMNEQ